MQVIKMQGFILDKYFLLLPAFWVVDQTKNLLEVLGSPAVKILVATRSTKTAEGDFLFGNLSTLDKFSHWVYNGSKLIFKSKFMKNLKKRSYFVSYSSKRNKLDNIEIILNEDEQIEHIQDIIRISEKIRKNEEIKSEITILNIIRLPIL